MSLLDSLGSGLQQLGNTVVSGVKDYLNPGSLIQAGASLLGGIQRNQASADQANAANEFSANQFATRYQTTVKDMQAAGLNPMLAYSQGASGQPSGQQAAMQDYVSPAVSAYQNSNLSDLQMAQAESAAASAGLNRKQIEQVNATVDKTRQEIENLKTDQERNNAVIKNLAEEYNNLKSTGENLKTQNRMIEQSINKILHEIPAIDKQSLLTSVETQLKQLDLKAAKDLGNVGRDVQQVKPLLDIIRGFLIRR